MKTVYLGDGLYARFDGFQFEVMANSHLNPTDTVYFNLDTIETFQDFIKECLGETKGNANNNL